MTDKGKILAVDDTPASLKLLSDLLRNEGYDVRSAINGALALRSAALNPPELVLLDIRMPEMDGFTLTRNIKQDARFHGLPVVIHSSLSGSANEDHVRSVGADGYVAKFVAEDLAETIRRVLPK